MPDESLSPLVVPLVPFFFGGGGSPTKIGYRKKGTLILTGPRSRFGVPNLQSDRMQFAE